MSSSNRKSRRVPEQKPLGKEQTMLIEVGSSANLPEAVGPSDSDLKHSSWSRLDHLYRLTKLLCRFENTERTVREVLSIVANTLPLRSAVLIDEAADHAQVSVWNGEGQSEQHLRAARDHAIDSYAYLTGSRSTSETTCNIVREGRVDLKKRSAESDNFIVIPLVVDRRPVFGAFQLEFRAKCNEADLLFVNAIVNQLAIAIDRHKAWQHEMAARREAEAARQQAEAARQEAEAGERRMRFLADASRLLSASLDYRSAWENMARLAVAQIADYCIIDILEDHSLRQIVLFSPDHNPQMSAKDIQAMATGVAKGVFESRSPVIYPGASNNFDLHEARARDPEQSFESYMCVPLRINEHALGTLTLVSTRPGHFYNQVDLVLLEDLARRAVVAFESAHLYADALHAIRSRDDVLNAVSHDLKGPLTVVLTFVQMFLQKSKPDEALICDRQQVEAVHRQAKQMNSLIDDLLDTAKIEARHLCVDREVSAIVPLITEALELPRILASNKGLDLKTEVTPDLPGVLVDRNRIIQVFANLIGNAIKFTASGGRIIVRAEILDEEDMQFCVEDTGPGINEEEIPHLFDRFWQARKTARHGTGLGLFIVKGIIEGHGGRVWVESTVGEGSKFFFTLPLMKSDQKA